MLRYFSKQQFHNATSMFNNNSQKGVAVYIALVVMAALLAIGIGISSLVVRQAKTFQDIGDSVFAFYAADAGIERLLQVDTCMIEEDQAARLACIQNTIEDAGFSDAHCDDGGVPLEADDPTACRVSAIDGLGFGLSNGSSYSFAIKPGGAPCSGTNYCGESTGTFEQALRRIEISR
jgi:hypothetical protein